MFDLHSLITPLFYLTCDKAGESEPVTPRTLEVIANLTESDAWITIPPGTTAAASINRRAQQHETSAIVAINIEANSGTDGSPPDGIAGLRDR
jgi:hypothetical protein